MAGVGSMTQDWEPVVIRKKTPNAAAKRDEKTANAARRNRAEIESVRKHEPVPTELKKAIMQTRGGEEVDAVPTCSTTLLSLFMPYQMVRPYGIKVNKRKERKERYDKEEDEEDEQAKFEKKQKQKESVKKSFLTDMGGHTQTAL